MGADARLFGAQMTSLNIKVPPWPEPSPGDSLQAYACRVASALTDAPAIVGGASFGGMVALELAALIRPKAVILVGSCTGPASVAPYLRMIGSVAIHLPVAAFRPRPWTSPLVVPKFGQLDAGQRKLFWDMAAGTSPAFFRWACSAVLSWQPSPHDVPIFHLHGDHDRLIPLKRVKPTKIVEGAGHLLSLTHPEPVTAFIEGVVRGVA